MPIYEYRCANGHNVEVMQRMSDDSLTACTICGTPVQRVFHPVAVHFKGKGFYTTDYGRGKTDGDGKKSDSSSDSKPAKAESKKSGSDTKPSTDGGSKKSSTKSGATD